jgi:DNA-binding response OmpR family regulator
MADQGVGRVRQGDDRYLVRAGLVASRKRLLRRDQRLMHVRNREREPFDRSIDIRIGHLRRRVEPDPGSEPRRIRTECKRGLHGRAGGG